MYNRDDWDEEMEDMSAEVNWLIIPHNHKDYLHHDTCSSCVMEWAIYGSDIDDLGGLHE